MHLRYVLFCGCRLINDEFLNRPAHASHLQLFHLFDELYTELRVFKSETHDKVYQHGNANKDLNISIQRRPPNIINTRIAKEIQ